MKKFYFLIALLILLPGFAFAEGSEAAAEDMPADEYFEAKVLEVLEEKKSVSESGAIIIQQNLKLKGLEGSWKSKEIIYIGVSDFEVIKNTLAKKGDKVIVNYSPAADGTDRFYVLDVVRRGWLYLLALLFSVLIIGIGKKQGLKSLISLAVSFFIIIKFIIPRIMSGGGPLATSIAGAIVILAAIIYLTWGWQKKSHIAMASIVISLLITGLISILFTKLSRLTGLAQEDAMFLVGLTDKAIDFQGLLLAGIIIGTLGVLDDVIISQVSAVEQISRTDSTLNRKALYQSAMKVGVDHISSMTNTLFLAYAGASLPLLLLFMLGAGQFGNFSQVINMELIATEIVRTLSGSVGLMIAVPLSTFVAARFYGSRQKL